MTKPRRPAKVQDNHAETDTSPQGADANGWIDWHNHALQQHFPLPDLTQLRAQAKARADRRRRRTIAGTTGIACLLGIVCWIDPAYHTTTIATARGEQQHLRLPDGSTAVVDGSARVQFRWHLLSRRAHVLEGRAYFEVAQAVYRPFTVHAGKAEVRVLGTRFDVSRLRDELTVNLHQGKVDVTLPSSPDAAPYHLTPGMTLNLRDGQIHIRHTQARRPDWADGQLVFERVPLPQALAAIQRYRTEHIRLTDPALAEARVSGVFQIDQLDRVFDLLPLVWPVQVERREGEIDITARP